MIAWLTSFAILAAAPHALLTLLLWRRVRKLEK